MSTDDPSADRVAVGRIGRAHGLRGAVVVEPSTDRPASRFSPGSVLYLDDGTELTVETFEATDRSPLVTFAGVSERNDAERLRGREVFIDPELRRPLDPDEFWPDELEGMEVLDSEGSLIGVVSGVEMGVGQDRLVVDSTAGASFVVPFVSELVTEVDSVARKVVVNLPEGLTD